MKNRVVVVTGASSGIGAAAVAECTRLGATVVAVGRSPEKTAAVAKAHGCAGFTADFTRLAEVRELGTTLAERYPKIDVLVNNAGAPFHGPTVTPDGLEATFQANCVAPFLLSRILLPNLRRGTAPRIITTSSSVHSRVRWDRDNFDTANYNAIQAYAASKLAGTLLTQEMARRFGTTGVAATSFHPGTVATNIFAGTYLDKLAHSFPGRLLFSTPQQGAEPIVKLATEADAGSINGAYFHKLRRRPLKGTAANAESALELWNRVSGITDEFADQESGAGRPT